MYYHFIRHNIDDLLKMYPDKKDSDYFLWIITDFFIPFKLDKITAQIFINNNPTYDYEGKIRKPYPNKAIFQYSMKKGRAVCYGFPLKFNSYEELMNVHTIDIEWEINIGETLVTTSIRYDIDVSYWDNIENHILDITHQISLLSKDNDIVRTCKEFDDVYLFRPNLWVNYNEDNNSTEGLYFMKCTNEDMYDDYDLEDAENFSSITEFFVKNQMEVVVKQSFIPEDKDYYSHFCLYKNLTNVDTVEGAEQL